MNRTQVACFEVMLGARRVGAVRSLCAMHIAGNRVTDGDVLVLGAVRVNAKTTASVRRGDRKPTAVSRRVKDAPARGVVVR